MVVERRTRRSPRMGGAGQTSRADRRQLSDSSDTGRSSDSGTDDPGTHDTASGDASDKDPVPRKEAESGDEDEESEEEAEAPHLCPHCDQTLPTNRGTAATQYTLLYV